MARVLATVSGIALKPGISKNRRHYSREAVADAVAKAQAQLGEGGMPLTTLTHHGAEDDSTRIVGAVRSLTLDEDGAARFTADIADTEHGRTIASLLDTGGGKPPFLSGVSIRGAWTGRVHKERGPDGSPVERGDSLSLLGLDYTASPGVPGAQVDTFAWAHGDATETTERVLITESVQEARVTITEEAEPPAPAAPEGVREALRAVFGEAATVPLSKRTSGMTGGKGTPYADPGYQQDGKQRYELDSPAHIRAAWAYVNQAENAKPYTGQQLKRIKARIKAAAAKAGVKITAEGWVVGPEFQVTETVAEYAGMDPHCAGSYSLSATNGPTTVTVCSYGLDPADLHVVLSNACLAASAALCTIDPDMDGDVDLPGDSTESTEDPGALAEASTPAAVTETATPVEPAPEPAAADREGSEAPAVSETTTTETAATAPASLTQADLNAAVAQALEAAETARAARKAAKRAAAAEAAPAAPAAVTETAAPRAPAVDIAALVKEGIAAALATEGVTETVTESVEDQVKRLVREGVTEAKQQIVAQGGGPSRKGLVTEHTAPAATDGSIPADYPMKDGKMLPSEGWTEDQNRAAGVQLQQYVLGARANQ